MKLLKKKLIRYISLKQPNNSNFFKLINNSYFNEIFMYYLSGPIHYWIEHSNIKNKE